jgi:hypothetical protein
MSDNQHNQGDTGWPKENDALGRELDAALAKYASVDPRPGLENRVLASLRAEQLARPNHTWWRWGLAGALAAIVIVAVVLAWKSGEPAHPVVAQRSLQTTQSPRTPATPAGSNFESNRARPSAPRSVREGSPHRRHPATPAPALPKLDQFPSRQAPSQEELALRRYVSEFPEEATLIARAQEEFEKEIEQKTDEARRQIDGKSFDQQER